MSCNLCQLPFLMITHPFSSCTLRVVTSLELLSMKLLFSQMMLRSYRCYSSSLIRRCKKMHLDINNSHRCSYRGHQQFPWGNSTIQPAITTALKLRRKKKHTNHTQQTADCTFTSCLSSLSLLISDSGTKASHISSPNTAARNGPLCYT